MPLLNLDNFTIKDEVIPAEKLASMLEADQSKDLSVQLRDNGYLLLRSVYNPSDVQAARDEILRRLAEVGEVAEPISDAISTGTSDRRLHYPNTKSLGAFWKSVSEGSALRRVINGPEITGVMEKIFGEKVTHFSFAWLRAMQAGKASPVHIDHPYMNRGTKNLLTCWCPIGPVGLDEGTLYVLENSHTWSDIRAQFEGLDVDRDKTRLGHIEDTPLALAARKSSRFLTTSFNPGDCLIFGMFMVHGSFDNNSPLGRIRLSCVTRFQPINQPMDPRFSGKNPLAHSGLGYGCLTASLPMNETRAPR